MQANYFFHNLTDMLMDVEESSTESSTKKQLKWNFSENWKVKVYIKANTLE